METRGLGQVRVTSESRALQGPCLAPKKRQKKKQEGSTNPGRDLKQTAHVISHMSSVVSHLACVTCHLPSFMCHLLCVICDVSSVMSHLSGVIWHVSPVIFPVSSVKVSANTVNMHKIYSSRGQPRWAK